MRASGGLEAAVRQREEKRTYGGCVKQTRILCLSCGIHTFSWPPLPLCLLSRHTTPPTLSLQRLAAQLRVSAERRRSEDGDFPYASPYCNLTIHIYGVVWQNGGLLTVLVRCYYGKLICVCCCVIPPCR